MTSQQLRYQRPEPELLISSKQQPSTFWRTQPATLPATIAAVVLTALAFAFVLCFGIANAVINRNGYAEIRLRRDLEDLRARVALLQYQNDVAESSARVTKIASASGMAIVESGHTDTVIIPRTTASEEPQLALGPAAGRPVTASALLSEFTAGGRAEASTDRGRLR